MEPIGLIAGSRTLPFVFAREARRRGESVTAIAFDGETDPALAGEVASIHWMKVGQLAKLIDTLVKSGVRRCVMLGQIAPKNLFDVRPDLKAMALLMRLKERNAHTVFGAIGDELGRSGVALIPAVPWLHEWMPTAGYRAGGTLTDREREDVMFGFRMAKEVSRLEIGQSVVVRQGTVLAVEGFEGTDACLLRGGSLAGKRGEAVAVKVAKQGHDMRFDLPCIGLRTLEVCIEAGIRVLAFESGMTVLLDRPELEARLRKSGVRLVAAAEL